MTITLDETHESEHEFARSSGLTGLTTGTLAAIRAAKPGYDVARGKRFLAFRERIATHLLRHRAIVANGYTAWFRQGTQNAAQLRDFIVQFSVFSNLFLIAQLHKMINADTLAGMRASKEILANEIGVTLRPGARAAAAPGRPAGDPGFIAAEGTVQGGTFRFEAAHFEWLLHAAEQVGLGFNELGRRRFGSRATLFFCDELTRLYGGEDYEVSQAASYAVENWAAAGFWKELIEGFRRYNEAHRMQIPLGFFIWHDRLEAQHAAHTQEELEDYYFHAPLDEDAFIRCGNEMLDGVAAFWDGLDAQRHVLAG